jgi:hypothetical protein
MTNAPERICVVNCGLSGMDCACFRAMYASRPIRADLPPTPEQIAADPRVQALVNLLTRAVDDIEKGWLAIKGVEEKYNTDGSWHIVQDARAALAQFNQEKETHQ